MELLSLSEEKLITLWQVTNNPDEIILTSRTSIRTKSRISWSSWEKSQWDGRIEESSRITNRWIFEKKTDGKSGQLMNSRPEFRNYGMKSIFWMTRVFWKWWFSPQWTIPRSQSTSVIPTSSRSWRNAKPLSGNAEPQRCAAKHLGHMVYRETFLQIQHRLLQHLVRRSRTHGFLNVSEHISPHVMSESQTPVPDQRCHSGSSARKFSHPKRGRIFKEWWNRPTTTADFGSSFWQIPYTNVRLLKDKIQDWGVYLFTISSGSCAMDQWSGVGWFSGSIKVFVINKRDSNARFRSSRCEDCFSTEPNNHNALFKKKVSLEEQKPQ